MAERAEAERDQARAQLEALDSQRPQLQCETMVRAADQCKLCRGMRLPETSAQMLS